MEDTTQSEDGKGDWHLAITPHDISLVEFEFGMERLLQAYLRWKVDGMSTIVDAPLTGDDIAILNVIRMRDEPKKLTEVARLLNRGDTANMQYAVRKLVKAELIEKRNADSRRDTMYAVTAAGRDATNRYAELRRELVTSQLDTFIDDIQALPHARALMDQLINLYETGSRRASAISSRMIEAGE